MSNIMSGRQGFEREQRNKASAMQSGQAENRLVRLRAITNKRGNNVARAENTLNNMRDMQLERLQDLDGKLMYLRGLMRMIRSEFQVLMKQRAQLVGVIGRVRMAQARAMQQRAFLGKQEQQAAAAGRLMGFLRSYKAQDALNSRWQAPASKRRRTS